MVTRFLGEFFQFAVKHKLPLPVRELKLGRKWNRRYFEYKIIEVRIVRSFLSLSLGLE